MIREKPAFIAPGLLTFLFLVVLELLTIAALVALIIGRAPALLIVLDIIAIAAVGMWRVSDTAEAVFQVDNYENFVKVQTEAAVRNLATSYAYDSHQDDRLSLRTSSDEITGRLRSVVQLDEERKAAMVSNLLVVLCSEQNTQPVVNTGTLYT